MLSMVVDYRPITMEFYVLLLNTIFITIVAEPSCEQRPGYDVGEYGEYFEGDMILTEAQQKAVEAAKIPYDVNDDDDDNAHKNGIIYTQARWPNKTVTYYIDEGDFSKKEKTMIEDGIKDLASKSCVLFRKRQNNREYAVLIHKKRRGCFSYVGYLKGTYQRNQVLNLASECFIHGIIVHEMLHTLGFYHMQSTYDRDDYVTIVYENIIPGYESNFIKFTNRTVTDFGVPYDYGSVMHYGETAFSKNGQKTIIPKQEGVMIGQRKGLSKRDILKLNRMYNCSNQNFDCDWDF